jgi:16S rRNA (guanine527-N7)-methyltransferase
LSLPPDHMRALLAPFVDWPLTEAQLSQIAAYLELLLRWNARVNLTAVRAPEQIVARHFGESLFAAARLFPPDANLRVFDLGSGAGFPGLPMKIFAPAITLTLIESNQKKAAFLKEAVRALSLMNVSVFAGRAEDLDATADLVTMRAVERYERALPIAACLVAPAGRLALLIGSAQADVAHQMPRFSWQAPIPIPQSSARVILVGTNQGS